MELIVSTENRFYRGPHNRPLCADGTHAHPFWQRYLDAFDSVTVVGRCSDRVIEAGAPVEGASVRLCPLPDSKGVAGAIARRSAWRRLLRQLAQREAAFCVRVPGVIGTLLWAELERAKRRFAAEIVGDPAELFSRSSYRHPLRPWIQSWLRRSLARQCQCASATAYVTKSTLQHRYPPHLQRFSTHYSSINLDTDAYRNKPRSVRSSNPWRVISVGTMSQIYKGFHVLIEAVALILGRGHNVHLTLVGDGRFRDRLVRQASDLGLGNRIRFTGRLSTGRAVLGELDQADIFVMPSLTEGLPRALIEAQARALPCLGSAAGGIPELLDPPELVPPGDAAALASAIEDLMLDPERLRRLSAANLSRARAYSSESLRRRRIEFYQHLATVSSLESRPRGKAA